MHQIPPRLKLTRPRVIEKKGTRHPQVQTRQAKRLLITTTTHQLTKLGLHKEVNPTPKL